MSKAKTIFTICAISATVGATAYFVGKYSTQEVKVVEKVVEVQADTSQQDKEIADLKSAMSASNVLLTPKQRQIIELLNRYGITGAEKDIQTIIDASHWMAVAMYRECGICTPIEAQILGHSLILHLKEKKHGQTMEQVVKWKERNGVYFLSFVPLGLLNIPNEDDYLRYFGYALSLISQSTDTATAQRKYDELYKVNGLEPMAIYWCNDKASTCSWHKKEVKNGCFFSTRIDLRETMNASIQDSDIGKHIAYLQTGKCKK